MKDAGGSGARTAWTDLRVPVLRRPNAVGVSVRPEQNWHAQRRPLSSERDRPDRLLDTRGVMFNSAAPGVLLAGAGALFCGIKYNSPLCLEAGSILHDSPERSESFLCARGSAVQLSRRMNQIGLNRKL